MKTLTPREERHRLTLIAAAPELYRVLKRLLVEIRDKSTPSTSSIIDATLVLKEAEGEA